MGAKVTFTCPPWLAYGSQGLKNIPPNSYLIFDIEVVGITNWKVAEAAKAKAEREAAVLQESASE